MADRKRRNWSIIPSCKNQTSVYSEVYLKVHALEMVYYKLNEGGWASKCARVVCRKKRVPHNHAVLVELMYGAQTSGLW